MNVRAAGRRALDTYDEYIHEIIIVDDNSTDGTAEVAREAARTSRASGSSGARRRTASGAPCATATRPRQGATS